MKLRLAVSFLGGLLLAVGCGLAWALHFPSTPENKVFFGGMLIPLAWVGAMLWLWFGSPRQMWARLLGTGLPLYAAVLIGVRLG